MRNQTGMVAAVALATLFAGAAMMAAEEPAKGLLGPYESIHRAMAGDRADGVTDAAQEIATIATAAAQSGQHAAEYEAVAKAARAMAGDDLSELREQYRELSVVVAKLVESGALEGADIYYCPMADGYWLQEKADLDVRNPYYGSMMLSCGSIVEKVEG